MRSKKKEIYNNFNEKQKKHYFQHTRKRFDLNLNHLNCIKWIKSILLYSNKINNKHQNISFKVF